MAGAASSSAGRARGIGKASVVASAVNCGRGRGIGTGPVIDTAAASATAAVATVVRSGVGSANAVGTLDRPAAVVRVAGTASGLAIGGADAGAVGAAAVTRVGGSMATEGHTDSGGGAGCAGRGGGDGTVASTMGPGMAMVGGEMKERTNQVTPATQATTGMTTAKTETHRCAGLRSRTKLPSKSMSASPNQGGKA
jgi:hypothetical protein